MLRNRNALCRQGPPRLRLDHDVEVEEFGGEGGGVFETEGEFADLLGGRMG